MKIDFIEVSGFRGFRNRTRFEFPPGYTVLTGRNGAGKSTVLDAIDFVLTGSINKYAVTTGKGGGLAEHIWWVGSPPAEQSYVTLGLVEDNGKTIEVRRSRSRGLEVAEKDLLAALCVSPVPVPGFLGTLARTSLIRDETIAELSVDSTGQGRFGELKTALGEVALPGLTARVDALRRAAVTSRDQQSQKTTALKDELSRALASVAEARGLAGRHADVAEADAIITRLFPSGASTERGRAEVLRREVASRRYRLTNTRQLVSRVRDFRARVTPVDQAHSLEAVEAVGRQIHAQQKRIDELRAAVETAERREGDERRAQGLAGQLAELISYGKLVGLRANRCPLCGADRTAEQFAQAIAKSESALTAEGSRLAEAVATVAAAQRQLNEAVTTLHSLEERRASLSAERARVSAESTTLEVEARQAGFDLTSIDQAMTSPTFLVEVEEVSTLERALLILESSMAHDRVIELEGTIERLKTILEAETAELAVRERVMSDVNGVGRAVQEVSNEVLEEQFDTVLPVLEELYQRLRPHAEWRDLTIDFGGRIRASLNFSVGDGRNPQFLFSSGQRRAAGLSFLLALHLSRPWCRLQSLLMDDPVQHIDDYRSLNLVEVLAAIRRANRQIIVAVEDAALADLLCRRLGSSAQDRGRRFEIAAGADGSSSIADVREVPPLPADALLLAVG